MQRLADFRLLFNYKTHFIQIYLGYVVKLKCQKTH